GQLTATVTFELELPSASLAVTEAVNVPCAPGAGHDSAPVGLSVNPGGPSTSFHWTSPTSLAALSCALSGEAHCASSVATAMRGGRPLPPPSTGVGMPPSTKVR